MVSKKIPILLVLALVTAPVGRKDGLLGQPTNSPGEQVLAGECPADQAAPVPTVAPADSLADNEAAITTHIKALHDGTTETGAAAASDLRRIVAKYPSRTVYLSSNDGGEAVWQEKVNQVKPGMTQAEVLKILPSFPAASESFEIGSGDSHVVVYRLDYHWTVTIQYRNPDKVIERPTLDERAFEIHVPAPKNFTGTWSTWHVNGQKGHEIQYKDGKCHGTLTVFHDNGAKSCEQHYSNHEAHGGDTGWYPNGKMSYSGKYRNGKQHGKWIHWHPNGNKHSESNYDDGKYDGLNRRWHENGQIASENAYKKGVKHGIEASWDKNGVLDYKREFNNGVIVIPAGCSGAHFDGRAPDHRAATERFVDKASGVGVGVVAEDARKGTQLISRLSARKGTQLISRL